MAQMPQAFGSRAAFRDDLKAVFVELVQEGEQQVEGGSWDGVPVLTRKTVDEAVAAVFNAPLPPYSDTRTEVATPGTILVSADCPKCHIASVIVLTVSSKLEVDDQGAELKLRAKAKARTHVCGQQSLPLDDLDGQESFELGEIVRPEDALLDEEQESPGTGEPMEGIEVPADGTEVTLTVEGSADLPNGATSDDPVCDWPGCIRHAFHRGKHTPPTVDGDSDVLPA